MVSAWWLLAAFWAGVCVGVVLVGLFGKVDNPIDRAERAHESSLAASARRQEMVAPAQKDVPKAWHGKATVAHRASEDRSSRGPKSSRVEDHENTGA